MNEDLYTLIHSCWKTDGSFSLPSSRLPAGSPAAQLVAAHFPQGTLALVQATEPKRDEENVLIENAVAVADLLGYKAAQVKFRFYTGAAGEIHFEMKFSSNAQIFRFDDCFPSVKAQANWGYLSLTDVSLELNTRMLENTACAALERMYAQDRFSDEQEKRVVKGWRISGFPGLPPEWKWIYGLLGDPGAFRLSGPLEWLDGWPRFALVTELFKPVSIGHLQPAFAFEMLGWLAEFGRMENDITTTCFSFRFRGELGAPLGESPKPVTLYALWGLDAPRELQFLLDAQLSFGGALEALDRFFNLPPTEGLSTLLPKENFPVVKNVLLKTISFSVSIAPLKLKSVTATMGLKEDESLIIFPDVLKAKKLELKGELSFDAEHKPFMNLLASGDIEFSAGTETVVIANSFELPSLEYSVGLAPGSIANLSALVRQLFPALGTLPDVMATTLSCSGTIKPPSLFFESAFESAIEVEWLYMKLRQFGVSFFASRVNNETVLEAQAFATLLFADRVEVLLGGSISKEQFMVKGEIRAQKPLTLPEILPANVSLPDQFKSWEFTSGSVTLKKGKENEISFSLTGRIGFDFGALGNMHGTMLSVTVKKDEKEGWSVAISADGGISLFALSEQQDGRQWLIDLEGTVKLEAHSITYWQLDFLAKGERGTIGPVPFPLPKKINGSEITLSQMTVAPKKVSLSIKDGHWLFVTTSNFKLDTFGFLQQLIPADGTDASLRLERKDGVYEASLELENLIHFTAPIRIPERQGMRAIDLGNTRFELSKSGISISSKMALNFYANVSWYLPEYLNDVFGTEGNPEEHRPRFRFFRTYKAEGRTPKDALSLGFKIGVNTQGQPAGSVTLESVPLELLEPEGNDYLLRLGAGAEKGKYGIIRFAKPTLAYSAISGFEMSIRFEIEKDPAVPLKPLRDMLENAGLKQLADALPDPLPIPLKDPPRFFDNNGFNWTLIEDLFRRCGQQALFPAMKAALEPLEKRFVQLPDVLKNYLQPPGLRGASFNLKASPTGNVEVGFEMLQDPDVKPDDPSDKKRSLQVLLVPGLPLVFFGLRLRKFNFGQLFGGQLFTVLFDADVDVFDIFSLAASLTDDENVRYYIGNSKNFTRNIQLYDLRLFIIWQTQIPLVVPAFYRQVGIQYYGLGDVRFESSFAFPEPALDLAKLGVMLRDLVNFIRDPKAEMPENADYRPMDLAFKMGPLYLETGKWMGSKVIGWKTPLTPPGGITLSSLLARLLNTIKFFSVNRFIRSIPFDNRHAEGELVSGFLGMKLGGGFLLSTPYEFYHTEAKDWKLTPEQTQQLMSVLPGKDEQPVTPETPGIVLFMRGEWQAKFGSLQTSFGLIAINSKSFATGFRFEGKLAGALDISTAAFVTINPPSTPFAFAGRSRAELKVAGMTFFYGMINAAGTASRFAFDGELKLTEPGQTFNINGDAKANGYFDQENFFASGSAAVTFLIFSGRGEFEVKALSSTSASGRLKLDVPGAVNFDTGFSLSENGFTVDVWANLFAIFNARFYAVLSRPARTVNFTLDSKPLGGLFGFSLLFDATFGDNNGRTGNFYIDLIPGLIPNARIFSGTCTFSNNHFGIKGRLDLLALGVTLEGNFYANGFELSGKLGIPNVVEITVTISSKGIGFMLQLPVGQPLQGSLSACNDTLYICANSALGPVSINLKTLEVKARACPCDSDVPQVCEYGEMDELLLLVAGSAHKLFSRKPVRKSITVTSDKRYRLHITRVSARKGKAHFKLSRRDARSDFFTVIRRDVIRLVGKPVWDRYLSLSGAWAETTALQTDFITAPIALKMHFPKAPVAGCRSLEMTISHRQPELPGKAIARVLLRLEGQRMKEKKKTTVSKVKKHKPVLKKAVAKTKKKATAAKVKRAKPVLKKAVSKTMKKKPLLKKAVSRAKKKKTVSKRTNRGKPVKRK